MLAIHPSDQIGRDSCLPIMQVLHDGLADSKCRPCPFPVRHLEAGCLGRKTRRGFDDYPGEKPVPTRLVGPGWVSVTLESSRTASCS